LQRGASRRRVAILGILDKVAAGQKKEILMGWFLLGISLFMFTFCSEWFVRARHWLHTALSLVVLVAFPGILVGFWRYTLPLMLDVLRQFHTTTLDNQVALLILAGWVAFFGFLLGAMLADNVPEREKGI
jgi:hypothetical protein